MLEGNEEVGIPFAGRVGDDRHGGCQCGVSTIISTLRWAGVMVRFNSSRRRSRKSFSAVSLAFYAKCKLTLKIGFIDHRAIQCDL